MRLPDHLEFSPKNWRGYASLVPEKCKDMDEAYTRVLAEVPWDSLAAQENGKETGIPKEAMERMRSIEAQVNPSWKTNPLWPQLSRWLYWGNWAKAVRLVFDVAEGDTPGEYGINTMPFVRELQDEAAAWQGHFGEEAARIAAPRFFLMAALDFLLRHGPNVAMRSEFIGDKYAVNRFLHDKAIWRYTAEICYEQGKIAGRGGQWALDEARVANAEARVAEAEAGQADAEAKMHHALNEAAAERAARKRAEAARKRENAVRRKEATARATAEALAEERGKRLDAWGPTFDGMSGILEDLHTKQDDNKVFQIKVAMFKRFVDVAKEKGWDGLWPDRKNPDGIWKTGLNEVLEWARQEHGKLPPAIENAARPTIMEQLMRWTRAGRPEWEAFKTSEALHRSLEREKEKKRRAARKK